MNREKTLLGLFDIGLVLKAANGALELLGAGALLLVPRAFVLRVVEFATAGELANDPDDSIAASLRSLAHAYAVRPHDLFALYLALHGAIKMLLVIGIIRGYRIAYPLFIAALGVFGAYEVYRGIMTSNVFLVALASLDFLMIFLTAHEYRLRGVRKIDI